MKLFESKLNLLSKPLKSFLYDIFQSFFEAFEDVLKLFWKANQIFCSNNFLTFLWSSWNASFLLVKCCGCSIRKHLKAQFKAFEKNLKAFKSSFLNCWKLTLKAFESSFLIIFFLLVLIISHKKDFTSCHVTFLINQPCLLAK